jgi:ATP-dependent Clp protease ATP-binding subunit ClpC
MFERYTEKARRAIFFARYEAAQVGSQAIDAGHILLGVVREDRTLAKLIFVDPASDIEAVRREVALRSGTESKIHASVDLPLDPSAKRVLQWAADESERLHNRHIGTEHLLLGLVKDEGSIASDLLRARGISADQLIAQVRGQKDDMPQDSPYEAAHTLPGKLQGLVDRLVHQGVFSRAEFNEQLAKHLPDTNAGFNLLLDLLVSKGVISEEEKRKISSGQS